MSDAPQVPDRLEVLGVDGVGEVRDGDDLAEVLLAAAPDLLADGDVVLVTSKVVSKAEGRQVPLGPEGRDGAVLAESVAQLARRGTTRVVRTRHGLVLAAAGVDASNTPADTVVLLPRDPDGSARRLRAALLARTGLNLGVLVTDTAGRAWRHGQTDLAIGAAGVLVLDSHEGRTDAHGHQLAVTAPALADELAAAADLVQGKATGRAFAVVRGARALVLPVADDGPGATVLVRESATDMFGLGAREAALAAVGALDVAPDGFGGASPVDVLLEALATAAAVDGLVLAGAPPEVELLAADGVPIPPLVRGRAEVRAEATIRAHGWTLARNDAATGPAVLLGLRPRTP